MRFEKLLTAVDVHAAGMPGRVITGGVLDVPGETMFEKARHLEEHRDDLRQLMLREPRGYPALCCNVILPPTRPEADAGYVIMEHVEYPAMSGSNTICVATVLIETGMVEVTEPITRFTLEAPLGLIEITARVEDGKATEVTFRNQPAYAAHLDVPLEVSSLGTVSVDIAWGGMFYVIAEAAQFGLRLTPDEARDIVRIGESLRVASSEQYPVVHPENPAIAGVTISQLSGPPHGPEADRRNAVTMSTGQPSWDRPHSFIGSIDRSPCGTGTCAKMATLHARGELPLGEDFRHESVLGTRFVGRLIEETSIGDHAAVVPTLTGQAWITGFAQYVLDPTDPFPTGYTVPDIWSDSAQMLQAR
jgi:proline racemase